MYFSCKTLGWWSQLKGNCKYKIYYLSNLLVVDIKILKKKNLAKTNISCDLTLILTYCKFMEDYISQRNTLENVTAICKNSAQEFPKE